MTARSKTFLVLLLLVLLHLAVLTGDNASRAQTGKEPVDSSTTNQGIIPLGSDNAQIPKPSKAVTELLENLNQARAQCSIIVCHRLVTLLLGRRLQLMKVKGCTKQ